MSSPTGAGAVSAGRWLRGRNRPIPVAVPVADGCDSYRTGDGEAAVLLSHGFTGSPRSLRDWADHLAADGFHVSVPRLPGHGTTWQELDRTRWPDWYGCLEREFRRLADVHRVVFVGGLSMGGGLALRLAEQLGERVAGIAVVNPSVRSADPAMHAVPLLRMVRRSVAAIGNDIAKPGVVEGAYPRTPLAAVQSLRGLWRDVEAGLGRVDQPLLIFKSTVDHVVDASSLEVIRAQVRSAEVETVTLSRSYHVATMDEDAPVIFTTSSAFFRRFMSRG